MYSARDRMIPFQVEPGMSGWPPTLPGPRDLAGQAVAGEQAVGDLEPGFEPWVLAGPSQVMSRVATVSNRSGPVWVSQVDAPSGVAGSTVPCLSWVSAARPQPLVRSRPMAGRQPAISWRSSPAQRGRRPRIVAQVDGERAAVGDQAAEAQRPGAQPRRVPGRWRSAR